MSISAGTHPAAAGDPPAPAPVTVPDGPCTPPACSCPPGAPSERSRSEYCAPACVDQPPMSPPWKSACPVT